MRVFLAFILLAAVCMCESPLAMEIPEEFEAPGNNGIDFLKGFLEGIGENGDINKLLHCLKDIEHIMKKIMDALNHLKKMKIHDVIKGLKMLVEAVKEFMSMLKPCISGFKRLEKLIMEIAHINFMKIAMHIITHPGKFIHAITDAINGFTHHNYHQAGKGVGALLAVIFLGGELEQDNPAFEFLKGFLEGLGETEDVNKLLKCLKDMEGIFHKIMEALEHLKKGTPQEIIKGITILVAAVMEFMQMLKPCMEGFHVLEKLLYEIMHINILKVVMRVMSHLSEFINAVMESINGFASKNFHAAGHGLGAVLKIMFLTGEEEDQANNALEFMKGFLKGIGESGNVNNLEKCIKGMDSIFHKIIEAINHIKKKKLNDIIVGITMLVAAVKEMMNMLNPCTQGLNTLKKLFQAISHPDIKKIAMRIIMHPSHFMHAIEEAISGFSAHNYEKAGHGVGSLLKLMFL